MSYGNIKNIFSKEKNNINLNKSYQNILDLLKINIDVCQLWFWLNKKYEREFNNFCQKNKEYLNSKSHKKIK